MARTTATVAYRSRAKRKAHRSRCIARQILQEFDANRKLVRIKAELKNVQDRLYRESARAKELIEKPKNAPSYKLNSPDAVALRRSLKDQQRLLRKQEALKQALRQRIRDCVTNRRTAFYLF